MLCDSTHQGSNCVVEHVFAVSAKPYREVHFPAVPGGWHGFFGGERYGLRGEAVAVRVSAPRRVIPLFVRAGSVLPLGPRKQWTGVGRCRLNR